MVACIILPELRSAAPLRRSLTAESLRGKPAWSGDFPRLADDPPQDAKKHYGVSVERSLTV
jgi:hypothetical protein